MENDRRLTQTEIKEVPLAGSGTAFPSAPPAGFRFFRTDLGWECYYDGTRWLTAYEDMAILAQQQTISTSPNNTAPIVLRANYQPYITRVVCATRVSPTNDGSHYWAVTVQGLDIGITTSDTIDSFTTAADTASARTLHATSAPAIPNPGNHVLLRISVSATGSPSPIELIGSIWYRLIVT